MYSVFMRNFCIADKKFLFFLKKGDYNINKQHMTSEVVIISCQEMRTHNCQKRKKEMRTHSDLSFLLYFQAIQQPKTSGDHQLLAHFCLDGLKKDLLFR